MLKTVYVLLSDVVEADANVRDHSDGDPDLEASIKRFGFIDPTIRDDRTGKLLDGHGRLHKLRQFELAGGDAPENIQVTPKGWKIPVVTGWASSDDAEAEAAAIAIQPKDGRYNEDALYRILHRQDSLDGLGFADDDVADLGRRIGALAEENTAFLDRFITPETPPALDSPTDGMTPPDPDGDDPGPSGNTQHAALSGVTKVDDDRVVLTIPMSADQRRQVIGLLNHAKARAGLPTHTDALIWALEHSPAAPSVDEDGARRAADTVRSALHAMREGNLDQATTIMNSLVGVPA